MNLNTFPKDVLVYMALDMDIGDIISLCKGNKELNLKICENKDLWYNKLNKDFPNWGIITSDKILKERELKELKNIYIDLKNAEKISGKESVYDKYYIVQLEKLYPDTDFISVMEEYKKTQRNYISYKQFYENVMSTIKGMENKFGYKYTDGNPFKQFDAIKRKGKILLESLANNYASVGFLKYGLEKGEKLPEITESVLDYYETQGKLPYSKNGKTLQEFKLIIEKMK